MLWHLAEGGPLPGGLARTAADLCEFATWVDHPGGAEFTWHPEPGLAVSPNPAEAQLSSLARRRRRATCRGSAIWASAACASAQARCRNDRRVTVTTAEQPNRSPEGPSGSTAGRRWGAPRGLPEATGPIGRTPPRFSADPWCHGASWDPAGPQAALERGGRSRAGGSPTGPSQAVQTVTVMVSA